VSPPSWRPSSTCHPHAPPWPHRPPPANPPLNFHLQAPPGHLMITTAEEPSTRLGAHQVPAPLEHTEVTLNSDPRFPDRGPHRPPRRTQFPANAVAVGRSSVVTPTGFLSSHPTIPPEQGSRLKPLRHRALPKFLSGVFHSTPLAKRRGGNEKRGKPAFA
jgi:hypothetical protein